MQNKPENNSKFDKIAYNRQYAKTMYKQFVVKIRKDDCVLKLLEKYRNLRPNESMNKIAVDALFEYLNLQISKVEKVQKRAKKNDTNQKTDCTKN